MIIFFRNLVDFKRDEEEFVNNWFDLIEEVFYKKEEVKEFVYEKW